MNQCLTFGVFQINRYGFLVAVRGEIIGAFRCILAFLVFQEWRAPEPRVIAFARFFDLDNLRPQIAQNLCAKGPREHAGEVEYANAFKRFFHFRAPVSVSSIKAPAKTIPIAKPGPAGRDSFCISGQILFCLNIYKASPSPCKSPAQAPNVIAIKI